MPDTDINLVTFILEDDEIVQTMITEVFRLNGIQNFQLFTSSADLLARESVDICVLDYYLGEKLNGMAVMKIIRERNPDCFVIIMSGQTDCKIIIEFLNAGANKYVDKNRSDHLVQLVQFVQEGIAQAKKKKELNHLITKFKASQNARS
jgi:two-component system, NtrC family, C4-dicarboxylate transport response regulator DctD